jgi:cysteine synthase A
MVCAEKRLEGLSGLIGNTPLLEMSFTINGAPRKIYAKAENFNLTGSIKDRMALHIFKKGYEQGKLKPGDRVLEATSGNTGIAIAAIGRALGHGVDIFMPDWMSEERKNLIRSHGAEVHSVSRRQGGFLGSIKMAEELASATEDSFLPRQFSNSDNPEAHFLTTGPEIWHQLKVRNLIPDAFVAGVGTGGTIMGTGTFLKGKNPNIRLHPLEPENSPTLSTGYNNGKHRIQGISDEFIPDILKLDALDEIIAVDDGDAIAMTQKLASELGIGVGISSGANFLGAVKVLEQLHPDAVVVTVFADDNKKYLSTDLLKNEPMRTGFVSQHINLESYKAFKRVCETCYDPEQCGEFKA